MYVHYQLPHILGKKITMEKVKQSLVERVKGEREMNRQRNFGANKLFYIIL